MDTLYKLRIEKAIGRGTPCKYKGPYWKCNFPMTPHVRWSIGQSVIISWRREVTSLLILEHSSMHLCTSKNDVLKMASSTMDSVIFLYLGINLLGWGNYSEVSIYYSYNRPLLSPLFKIPCTPLYVSPTSWRIVAIVPIFVHLLLYPSIASSLSIFTFYIF